MKRLRITLEDLAARPNLELATWKAARGKRARPAVARWLADLDRNFDSLAAAIVAERVPSAGIRRFAIHDPKRREISVHAFADRVLHHAILNLAEPRFETMLVDSCFACRPGRGVHAAVAAVQHHLRRFGWWVQVDVAAYFASIDHAILLDLLRRRFKGEGFLALLGRIVAAGSPAGRALPIGALTSQHFANAYLDGADRWLLGHADVCAHARYMDDIVWWCDSRDAASATLAALREHLRSSRWLELKCPSRIGRSERGLAFCGFRIRPGLVLPSARKLARFRAGARRLAAARAAGSAADAELQRAHDVLAATLAHTESLRFRRRVWAGLGAANIDAA